MKNQISLVIREVRQREDGPNGQKRYTYVCNDKSQPNGTTNIFHNPKGGEEVMIAGQRIVGFFRQDESPTGEIVSRYFFGGTINQALTENLESDFEFQVELAKDRARAKARAIKTESVVSPDQFLAELG